MPNLFRKPPTQQEVKKTAEEVEANTTSSVEEYAIHIKKWDKRYPAGEASTTNKTLDRRRYPIKRHDISKDTLLSVVATTTPDQFTVSSYEQTSAEKLNLRKSTRYYRSQQHHTVRVLLKGDKKEHIANDKQFFGKKFKPSYFGLNKPFLSELGIKGKFTDENGESRNVLPPHLSLPQKLQTDRILNHKINYVKKLVKSLESSFNSEINPFFINPNQINSQYPCLIVKLNTEYHYHHHMIKNGDQGAHEYENAYSELVTQLMIATINKELCEQGFGANFDRRQSFGFLTPTATDVGGALRISLGLVPNHQWADTVKKGIENCNELIKKLWDEKIITAGNKSTHGTYITGNPSRYFEDDNILKSIGHKMILEKMLSDTSPLTELKKLFENPFFQYLGLIASKELTEDIDQSKWSDEKKVAWKMLSQLESITPWHEHFFSRLQIIIQQKTTENQKKQLPADAEFNNLFNWISLTYQILLREDSLLLITSNNFDSTAEKVQQLKVLTNRYLLESINQALEREEISETSDSEEEFSEGILKAYTPSGMSALYNPLAAFCLAKNNLADTPVEVTYEVKPYGYFELHDWQEQWATESNRPTIKAFDSSQHSQRVPDVIYTDNNPCVTGSAPPQSVLDVIAAYKGKARNDVPSVLVVDTTSSTEEQKKAIHKVFLETYIPFLVFGTSGVKNQQLSFDRAQYGENRLLINKNLDSHDQHLATSFSYMFKDLLKQSSPLYPTLVRREMREATRQSAHIINEETNFKKITPYIINYINKLPQLEPTLTRLISKWRVDLNAQDSYGYTLLHSLLLYHLQSTSTATEQQRFNQFVSILVSLGANINLKNIDGISALDLAKMSENSMLLAAINKTQNLTQAVIKKDGNSEGPPLTPY